MKTSPSKTPEGGTSPSPSSPVKNQRTVRRGYRSPLTILGVLLAGPALWFLFLQSSNLTTSSAGSLLDRRDVDLSGALIEAAKNHPYTKCAATALRARQTSDDYAPTSKVLGKLKKYTAVKGVIKGNSFVEFLIKDVPCWGMNNCCETNTYFRPGIKSDVSTFKDIFQDHDLRILYAIFKNSTPKYILDAGPGSGHSSQMFKKVFPNSVLVALEADPANFEELMFNTREVDGIHSVHGALWNKHLMLSESNVKGTHVLSLPSGGKNSGNIIGLSVQDLKSMFDIPAFDLVYMDIEGAESVVLGPGSDLSWIDESKVICIKGHEKMNKYYTVEDVLERMSSALAARSFTVVVDDEHHVIMMNNQFAQDVRNVLDMDTSQ